MTVPGKLLPKLDPGAIDRLAARLPAGTAVVSATNGKTTTAAMAAEILRPRFRLAHNAAGANLVSGVASTLLAAGDAELGLLEVDEAALPEILRRLRPRAVCLGNLFRDQLDRYGELELVAERWREAVGALPGGRPCSSAMPTTRSSLRSPRPRGQRRLRPRRSARRAPRAPARGRLEVLRPLRNAVRLRRARTSAISATTAARTRRPRAAAARRGRPDDRAARARARRVRPRTRPRGRGGSSSPARPLQRLQRARRGGTRPRARRVARRDRRRARAVLRGVRPLRAHRRRRQADPPALDQEPGRRERGRPDTR